MMMSQRSWAVRITVSDADDSNSDSIVAATLTGDYGVLTIDAAGNWTYDFNDDRGIINQHRTERLKASRFVALILAYMNWPFILTVLMLFL